MSIKFIFTIIFICFFEFLNKQGSTNCKTNRKHPFEMATFNK